MDPPPSESQPSGKIRKGFKLFGKRKPGNIFSIRSKGDGNNKSPVIKSKTSDGLSDSPAPDLEQEPDEEKGQEASQGEMEQAGDEIVGEDGVLAAAPARMSFSSVSSAKSLGFLSLLRGGRKGTGDRRVHTVSQPVGRQRRGLKGLFGNVKLRSKDKEDKEETPPSPLLMSSRANSVEIIKEDLTLTPKCQPRSPVSPETESCEQVKSSTTHDGSSTSSSEKAANVSTSNEHGPPVPTCESPLVPGDKSLSSLLADISSLLTFDSISGGGDIMADVEAEWGKATLNYSCYFNKLFSPSDVLWCKDNSVHTELHFYYYQSSYRDTTYFGQGYISYPNCYLFSWQTGFRGHNVSQYCFSPWPHEAQSSVKTRGTSQTTVDHQSSGPNTTGVEGSQTLSSKTKEQQIEPPTTLPEPSKEKRPSQVKGPGLSKIPVVGGGRVGKIPVRESQNVNDEPRRDPPTPVQDERPHFNSHEAGSKDKICTVEANVLTSKHTQEESQQPQQPKVVTSSARDSKIPVKHGTQPHTASNIPQTKDPTRSKIPTSKVPVRRVGNKPAATGGSTQIRK
ncbi:unnamed protein product [Menidia menidia]|uniref:(Atlantic silverside) hypothetical protein n=1 Tax=Menidia menidia TaxID=238744 RepID=A0A8S4AP72_9TELE|nr:unnamed protein product [Menidia menidia]